MSRLIIIILRIFSIDGLKKKLSYRIHLSIIFISEKGQFFKFYK